MNIILCLILCANRLHYGVNKHQSGYDCTLKQASFFANSFSMISVVDATISSRLFASCLFAAKDLVPWHPITGTHIKSGMSLEALSEAAISYSDNTAINLIIKKLGGSTVITDFAHSIGNQSFNLVHQEPHLNSNPAYEDDTVTPKDMAITIEKLTLGNVLSKPLRSKLLRWMTNSTTSYKRMRAAAPITWVVADKTGSGSYGVANDIGIMWSPACKPIVLAIYTAANKQEAKSRDDIVASTTEIILNEFAKNDACFKVQS